MTETWRGAIRWLSSWLPMTRDDDRPASSFHGAFLKQVAESIILRTTKQGDWIWDCFAGSGTTGLVAKELGRNCFMTDLSPTSDQIHRADATDVTIGATYHGLDDESGGVMVPTLHWDVGSQFLFDTVILHPPYHSIIPFSDPPASGDLSHCPDLGAFYNLWFLVCANIARHVKPGGTVCLVIGDLWQTGDAEVEPLGFNCMNTILQTLPNSKLKAIQVKNISGNRANAHRRNLLLSRFFRWFAVEFQHEYIFTICKGKK